MGHQIDAELLADDAAAAATPPAGDDEQAGPPPPAARLATRIPEWVYTHPAGPPADPAAWQRYRPDILIAVRGSKDGTEAEEFAARQLHIIELKYCRDTDDTAQQERAAAQHSALVQALISVGYAQEQVHLHIITLGVTGTIYKAIHSTLQVLGLNKRGAKNTCRQLHRHAVLSVATIMRIKWAQESARQKQGVG